jgi:hypothetical protein
MGLGQPGPKGWAPAVTESEGSGLRTPAALERRDGEKWVRLRVYGSGDLALEALDDAVGRGEGTADHYRIVELGRARWKTIVGIAVAAAMIVLVITLWILLARS